MPDLTLIYDFVGWLIPLDCMQARFMQQAFVGLMLLAPLSASMGVQVVNLKMSFFSDAISHSAFAGVAFALLFSLDPNIGMVILGLLLGLCIMWFQRRTALPSDAIIGVFFSGVVAIGLAIVSREPSISRNIQQYLYGDILSISDGDIWRLMCLFVLIMGFQALGYNRMLFIAISPVLARVHRVNVAMWQYTFAALLSIIVIYSVRALGVLLVTAMLILPAATARNLSTSSGAMFWWSVFAGLLASIAGLLISATDWARSATGATIVVVAFVLFIASAGWALWCEKRVAA